MPNETTVRRKNTSKATNTAAGERVRLQLELAPNVVERIKELQSEAGSGSMTEVIRRALGLYSLLMREAKAGNRVEIVGPGSDRRQLMVFEAT